MKFQYEYEMPDEEVRVRLQALGQYLQNRHGINIRWDSEQHAIFSGRYLVVKIDGSLSYGGGIINFNGQDPGMLWRKKALKYLQGKLATYLDPKTPPEALPRYK